MFIFYSFHWISNLSSNFSLAPCQPHDCSLCTSWNMLQLSHTTYKNSYLSLTATMLTPVNPHAIWYKFVTTQEVQKRRCTYGKNPIFSVTLQPTASSHLRFLVHAWHTVGRLPRASDQLVAETSTRRHNTHNRETFMSQARFKPTISAGERPHTYTLDSTTTGTDKTPTLYSWILGCPGFHTYFSCSPQKHSIRGLTLRRLMSRIYMEHPFLMFLDHTRRRSTVGRTPLDEWSARRSDLYLTTHDNHNRQISMPTVGFEPKISAGERHQYGSNHPHTPSSAHILYNITNHPHM